MRLYIATPINARKERTTQERFRAAKYRCEMLREILTDEPEFSRFTEIVTPFDINPTERQYSEDVALGRCVTAVLKSDAIYLDHCWQSSKGCNLEYRTAKIYGKEIIEHDRLVSYVADKS